ncbi:DNA-directed RNA polymerase subunit omega [Longirhabdus pacifica]|uniref:DNA-directed RNA polymerase subunit omega n=1 Tax=Longirhabdus pacifica TaxID=2305227 RepID=UPI001008A2A4|nr:DNA-directed RNA polymerase subunit omega [Longirhabdus pacifica]
MLEPSIDELEQKVGSKYSLVIASSRRARELRDGAVCLLPRTHSHKFVGMALEELIEDEVKIEIRDER